MAELQLADEFRMEFRAEKSLGDSVAGGSLLYTDPTARLYSEPAASLEYRVPDIPVEDLTPDVQNALQSMAHQVAVLRTALLEAQNRIDNLEILADHDALTPLLNRRAFVRELTRWMSYANRYKQPGSLIFFDVDNMKSINDGWSHAAGDAALLALSDILVRHSRSSDVVGRLGGDEFGMLLTHTDFARAQETAARFSRAIANEQPLYEGRVIPLSVTYGIHRIELGEEPEAALARADQAMYRDKSRKQAR